MAANPSPTPFESFSSSVDKVKSWLKEAISTEEPKSEAEDGPSTVEMFWPSRVNTLFRSLGNKQHSERTTGSTSPAISCSSARRSPRAGFLNSVLSLSKHSASTPSLVKRISTYRRTVEKRQQLADYYERRSRSQRSLPSHSGIEEMQDEEVPYQSKTVIDTSRLQVPTSTSSRQRKSTANDENTTDGARYSQSLSATEELMKTQSLNRVYYSGYSRQLSEPTAEEKEKIQTVDTTTNTKWYRQDSGFEDEREALDIIQEILVNPGYDHLYREQTEEISAADPYRVICRLTRSQIPEGSFRKQLSMNEITNLVTGINSDTDTCMNYPKIRLSIQYFMSTKELRVCFSEAKMLDTLSPSDRNSLVYMKTYLKPGKNAQKRTRLIQLSPSISMNDKIYFKKIKADDLSKCSLVVKVFKKRRYVPLYQLIFQPLHEKICFLLIVENKGVWLPFASYKVNQRPCFSLLGSWIQKVEKKLLEVYKNFENDGANQSTTNSCHKRPNPIMPSSTQPRSSKIYSAISVQVCVRQQTARLHIDQFKEAPRLVFQRRDQSVLCVDFFTKNVAFSCE